MSQSIDLNELQRVKENLSLHPQTLDELWFSYQGLWQELAWNKAQLSLWLVCQADIRKNEHKEKNVTYACQNRQGAHKEELGEAIVNILKVEQRPLPLNQIKNKLPSGTLATEPMLKKEIENHPQLSMMGPLVKLN